MELESEPDKALFSKTPSHIISLAILFILSVAIMTLDYRYKKLENIRAWVGTALYPIYLVADFPNTISDWFSNFFLDKTELVSQIETLGQENMLLKQQLQKKTFISNENQRLRGLLKMSTTLPKEDVMIAETTNIKLGLAQDELIINKGLADDVYIGQPVLNPSGVIGQIIHVTYKTSTVLLITSSRHALPVQLSRNLYRSVAHGSGADSDLRLARVIPGIELRIGDLVETSGMGGVFPPGYPVGVITTINTVKNKVYVDVTPYANNPDMRKVLLVWPPDYKANSSETN